MAAVLLTCNQTVPGPEHPGTPALVFYDNGEWEIAYNGDVDYLRDNPSFVGDELVSEILSELSLELGDDEMDQVDGNTILFLDVTIETGHGSTPILALFDDGVCQIMEQGEAQLLMEADGGVFNFIHLPELLDDIRKFLSLHRDGMFGREEEDDRPLLNFEEDEERD